VVFAYYARLSARDQATYRKSDGAPLIRLADPRALSPLVSELRGALALENRTAIEGAARSLSRALTDMLGVPPVEVKVLAVRPSRGGGELHGLYTRDSRRPPRIQVWMRTARYRRVVAFRTFLRTLLHEMAHHLDYSYLGLEDSFHTEGFFKRESGLMRELAAEVQEEPPPLTADGT